MPSLLSPATSACSPPTLPAACPLPAPIPFAASFVVFFFDFNPNNKRSFPASSFAELTSHFVAVNSGVASPDATL